MASDARLMAGQYRHALERARHAGDELSADDEKNVAAQALATASELFSAAADTGGLLRRAAQLLATEPGGMCLVTLADEGVLRPYTLAHGDGAARAQLQRAARASRDAGADAFS